MEAPVFLLVMALNVSVCKVTKESHVKVQRLSGLIIFLSFILMTDPSRNNNNGSSGHLIVI